MRKAIIPLVTILAFMGLLLAGSSLSAQTTYTFKLADPDNPNWSWEQNWEGGRVPPSVIPAGSEVKIIWEGIGYLDQVIELQGGTFLIEGWGELRVRDGFSFVLNGGNIKLSDEGAIVEWFGGEVRFVRGRMEIEDVSKLPRGSLSY